VSPIPPARGLGSAERSPSGVLDKAMAEIDLGIVFNPVEATSLK